jgi:FKBP-type peptidyl-prolyl cis-trans isomerase FklB
MRPQLFFPFIICLFSSTAFAETAPQASQPLNAPKAAVPTAAMPAPSNGAGLTNAKDKISYAIGVDMGANLKNQNIDINPEMLAKGIKDVMSHGQILLSQQEIGNTLAGLQKQIIAKREADFKAQSEQNKRSGDAFLLANKVKPGVVTLPSGLQYKIITQGNGARPVDKDKVTVNYVGTLINGQEFDSSYRRGKPVSFPVAEVIPGWAEALRLMKVGSVWEIYVPPSLAYGERGLTGGPIGPNQTLVFKVNLISIDKK